MSDLAARMARGDLTSRALVGQYVARIEALDRAGPTLRSIVELNPDAMAIAAALDEERRVRGPRGPLHGIPVVVKDNIDTGDNMQTTAGSLALLGAPARKDADVVARLREAGGVLLGKTNLSEWANCRSSRSVSGWSAPRRADEKPICARPEHQRIEFRFRRSRGREPGRHRHRDGDRRLDHQPVIDVWTGWRETDGWSRRRGRDRPHLALMGHRGPDGANRSRRGVSPWRNRAQGLHARP